MNNNQYFSDDQHWWGAFSFTYIFRIIISFLAAFLTFRPSFLLNFLQVYIFRVFLSLARNISQNSSLPEKGRMCLYTFIQPNVGISMWVYSRLDDLSEVILVGHLWGAVVILLLPKCQTTKWHGSSRPRQGASCQNTNPINIGHPKRAALAAEHLKKLTGVLPPCIYGSP